MEFYIQIDIIYLIEEQYNIAKQSLIALKLKALCLTHRQNSKIMFMKKIRLQKSYI